MATGSSTGGHPAGDASNGNSTGSAGGHGMSDAAKMAMFAQRQVLNERTVKYYAAALCGIIAIFTFLHWARLFVSRSSRPPKALTRPFALIFRRARNVLVRAARGFNSAGHGLLVAVYVAINFTLILTNVDKTIPGHVASRFAWVLMANMCFVVFLSLKNTPLAFLTAYSYERLNNLHQIAGCTTFLLMVLHSVTYTIFFWQRNMLEKLRETEQIAGIIAGFGLLGVFLSAMLVRRFAYETFKAMHILSFIVSVICIGFHRSHFKTRTPIILCLTGGMFAADRILRLICFLTNSINNEATVYPLPSGGTRIVLAKKPAFAVPGKHCFVWIPKIRKFELHPFTIIATKPVEFVVKSYDGFTRDLHAYASAHPGAKLRASLEGPYGTFPDPMEYDKIILIAGGSGASYTFGLAVNLLERMGAEATKNIVFIWTAKTHENLTWFTEHLNTLRTHPHAPKVQVSLYVTRLPSSSSSGERQDASPTAAGRLRGNTVSSQSSEVQTPTSPDLEKAMRSLPEPPPRAAVISGDTEKEMIVESERRANESNDDISVSQTSHRPILRHAVSAGRPDAATLIRAAVAETPSHQRVLVAACGPAGLMKVVRNTTAESIKGDGPGVELHCEQFGW